MGVRGNYNINIIKNNASKKGLIPNKKVFFAPTRLVLPGKLKIQSPIMGHELIVSIQSYRKLFPLPNIPDENWTELDMLEVIKKLSWLYVNQPDVEWPLRTGAIGTMNYEHDNSNSSIIYHLIKCRFLSVKNDMVSFDKSFGELMELIETNDNTIPFSWDTLSNLEIPSNNNLSILDLIRNAVKSDTMIKINSGEHQCLLGLDKKLGETNNVLGILDDSDNQLVLQKDMYIGTSNKISPTKRISIEELEQEHPRVYEEFDQLIQQSRTANSILEPFAIQRKEVLFYTMANNSPVFTSISATIVQYLGKKYGKENLYFCINGNDTSINTVNVFKDDNLLAVVPTNIVKAYDGDDRAQLQLEFVDLYKTYELTNLMKSDIEILS